MLEGVQDASASLLSSKAEWHIFFLGLCFGIIIVILWAPHRDAALTLLGGVSFLSVGQVRAPWSAQAAAARPLEMMPWYFLAPIVGLLALRVILTRLPHPLRKYIVLSVVRLFGRLGLVKSRQ